METKLNSSKTTEGKKLKKMDLSTKPKHILDTFQNCDLSPAEWENLADQVLKRGDQKIADEVRGRNQPASKKDKKI